MCRSLYTNDVVADKTWPLHGTQFPQGYLLFFLFFFFFFGVGATLQGMRDLSSLTSDRTCAPCTGGVES